MYESQEDFGRSKVAPELEAEMKAARERNRARRQSGLGESAIDKAIANGHLTDGSAVISLGSAIRLQLPTKMPQAKNIGENNA